MGMKFGRIVLHVNTHPLTESGFGHDIISSRKTKRLQRSCAATPGQTSVHLGCA